MALSFPFKVITYQNMSTYIIRGGEGDGVVHFCYYKKFCNISKNYAIFHSYFSHFLLSFYYFTVLDTFPHPNQKN